MFPVAAESDLMGAMLPRELIRELEALTAEGELACLTATTRLPSARQPLAPIALMPLSIKNEGQQ
jgi:hypothetical protein